MTIDKTFHEAVSEGRIPASEAIAALRQAGYVESVARAIVFEDLGGSDLIERGADGVDRYPSGKSVAEVERLLNS